MKNLNAIIVAALALIAIAPSAFSDVEGKIKTTEGKIISGKIRWSQTEKEYKVTQSGANGQSLQMPVPVDKVAGLSIPRPKKLDEAIKLARSGNTAAAIPLLQPIIKEYARLKFDEEAGRYLAGCQLKSGDAKGALKTCEDIIKAKAEAAYIGELASVYWEALDRNNRSSELSRLIDKAVAEGDVSASASALIRRGDMLMKSDKPLDALKDGYARVYILYSAAKEQVPEALFKAAQAFDKLNRSVEAEKLRQELRTKYAASSWAKKL